MKIATFLFENKPMSMQKNKVFTLGPVADNGVTIAPNVTAMIISHTLASNT